MSEFGRFGFKITMMKGWNLKDEFAHHLGFINAIEALCCLKPKNFNHQYAEFLKYRNQDLKQAS